MGGGTTWVDVAYHAIEALALLGIIYLSRERR